MLPLNIKILHRVNIQYFFINLRHMNRNNLRLVPPTIDDKKIGHRVDSLTIINYLVKCADLCLLLFALGHFYLKKHLKKLWEENQICCQNGLQTSIQVLYKIDISNN